MNVRANWKSKLFTAALAATTLAAFTLPAVAQIDIRIGRTPPPLRYERRPPVPGPGYAWIGGYWGVNGNRYVWVPGRWDRPPYEGAYWSHPHYDRYEDGWHYHEGHWDREDHGDRHWNQERDRDDRDRH